MYRSRFVRDYGVYFAGSIAVAFVNYLFYPVLGRFLSVEQFGEVQSIVSLLTQFGVITGAVSLVVVHTVASPGESGEKARIIAELRRVVLIGAAALALIVAVASPWLARYFHFDSSRPFVALGLLIFLSALPLFSMAYLIGAMRYAANSAAALAGSVARIIGSAGLALAGLGASGAALGLGLAPLSIWLCAGYAAQSAPELAGVRTSVAAIERPSVVRELRYAGLILVANLSVTVLYTSDILFAKRFFDPTAAGLYAGISAIAKIGYFALAPLASVILPSVAGDAAGRGRPLRNALLIYLALAVPGLLISYCFYGFIVTALFGARYAALAGLLPLVTLLMCLVALAQILSTYFIAMRRWALLIAMPCSAIVAALLAYAFHQSPAELVWSMIGGTAVGLAWLFILYAQDHLDRHPYIQRRSEYPLDSGGRAPRA